ncbi:MAG: ROK family protein, partial [Micrococcales bacterium]|nr:ROK family protein [Micrococcales bacterium]
AAGVAAAVRVIALAVDPRVVVIGGGVANLGEPLRVAVATALAAQDPSTKALIERYLTLRA